MYSIQPLYQPKKNLHQVSILLLINIKSSNSKLIPSSPVMGVVQNIESLLKKMFAHKCHGTNNIQNVYSNSINKRLNISSEKLQE